MPTILLIDDDVVLLASLSTELEQAGYHVLRTSEVRQAERMIAEERPDLVLLDTDTNRAAGWDLLQRIARQLPVIVISGQGLEEDIIRGLDMGAVDYIPKPFRSGELQARIRARLPRQPEQSSPPPAGPAEEDDAGVDLDDDLPPPEAVAPPEARGQPTRAAARGRKRESEEEEQIFIPFREEHRLLQEPQASEYDELRPEDLAQLSLGQRLHAARQRKRITLVQAELESKIRMHYIQAMEEEKFSLLPRGPVAEELLRTYAAYLGVDVSQASDEYRRFHYSAPVEPPPALGGSASPRMLPRWAVWLAAVILALVVGFGGLWLLDPGGVSALAERARELVVPPTPTPPPTSTPTPPPTSTPTPPPTSTPTTPPTSTPTPPPPTLAPYPPPGTPTPTVRLQP